MRFPIAAAAWVLSLGAAATVCDAAMAQTYSGKPLASPAVQQTILAAVASRVPSVDEPDIRDLRPSRARNGKGYCGLVSSGPAKPYQPFHVIIDDDGNPAVLILPEKGEPPGLTRDQASQLLRNFGCID